MKSKISAMYLIIVLVFGSSLIWAQGASDWDAIKDHTIKLDTKGWEFPTSIKFIKNPGKGPKDPLYYVTELRGKIKVVTNDRTIMLYAENVSNYKPSVELPDMMGEVGLTGLCLDHKHGYLFVTTAFYENNSLYNKVLRFEHETSKFALKPKKMVEFKYPFAHDPSGVSHQIGTCDIDEERGLFYVGNGDGWLIHSSQSLDHITGKIIRMNIDGTAPIDNPFYNPQKPNALINYIYAYGFRNPYSLALDDQGVLFGADNGPNKDRLIEVIPGKNYLWDGTNESMRSDGIWHWSGSVGPTSMIYIGEGTNFPYWKERVLVGQGGTIGDKGASYKGKIVINSFKVKSGRGLLIKPEKLVWFRGNYQQLLVPVAEGPDGIYFSGFFPDPSGTATILKLVPEKGKTPNMEALSGARLYRDKGCIACHVIQGEGGKAGPALDGYVDRMKDWVNSSELDELLEKTDKLNTTLHKKYAENRKKLRELEGLEKLVYWTKSHLKEPRFDREHSQMPNFNLSDEDIKKLTSYLLTLKNPAKPYLPPMLEWHRKLKAWWDTDYNARPIVFFILGMFVFWGSQSLIRRITKLVKKLLI